MQPVSGLYRVGGLHSTGAPFGATRGKLYIARSGQNPYLDAGELPLAPTTTRCFFDKHSEN